MGKVEVGTLNDRQIIESNYISRGFTSENVKQACYELRSGNIYYDLTLSKERLEIDDNGTILIKPGHLVVIITKEEISLPKDIIGRILTKGSFFSLGLSPVNTYADPGFKGKLGIVLYNCSSNYIAIPSGKSIAKLELSRLREEVETAYSGQHGYDTEIWPIQSQFIMKPEDIKKDSRIGSPIDELSGRFGSDFRLVTDRLFGYQRRILLAFFLVLAFNFFLLATVTAIGLPEQGSGWAIGILTNVTTGGLVFFLTTIRRK